jgi:outer membrane biogenesis lipoprotein LolB
MFYKTLFLALAILLTPACATTAHKDFCESLDEVVDKNDLQKGVKLMQDKLAEHKEAKTEAEKTKVLREELNKCGYYSAFDYNP